MNVCSGTLSTLTVGWVCCLLCVAIGDVVLLLRMIIDNSAQLRVKSRTMHIKMHISYTFQHSA